MLQGEGMATHDLYLYLDKELAWKKDNSQVASLGVGVGRALRGCPRPHSREETQGHRPS